LLLAAIGTYGVMAYTVTQRTREVGIRIALGAARRDVFRLILGQGLVLISIGIGVGVMGAFFARRALGSVHYGVGSIDACSFVFVFVSLAIVALLACFLPARRATLVDPIISLRAE